MLQFLQRNIGAQAREMLPSVRHVSARFLTIYYAVALVMMAGIFTGAHISLLHVLNQDRNAAQIITLSSRQRMLCQRIAMLAAQYRLGDPTAAAQMQPAIAGFGANEVGLVSLARVATSQDPAIAALRGLYAAGLDRQVAAFIADARLVASLPPQSPALAAPLARLFAAARGPLLDHFDHVVLIHEDRAAHVLHALERLQYVVLLVIMLTLTIEAFTIFRPMIRRIEHYTQEITRLATIDPLTGLANRRGFLETSDMEYRRAERYGRQISLLLVDADHFKAVNDAHGHAAGDAALRHLADTLRATLRDSDIAGRFGGEEFTVLLPETDMQGAALLAERLRRNVEDARIEFFDRPIPLTVSIGVAPVLFGTEATDATAVYATPLERALQAADQALYHAKQCGRNRVAVAV
jgi:diguanylate cyclase (GGDEF)-like protein